MMEFMTLYKFLKKNNPLKIFFTTLNCIIFSLVSLNSNSQEISSNIICSAYSNVSSPQNEKIATFLSDIAYQVGVGEIQSAFDSENIETCRKAKIIISIKVSSLDDVYTVFPNANVLVLFSSREEVLGYKEENPDKLFTSIYTNVTPITQIALAKEIFNRSLNVVYLKKITYKNDEYEQIKSISRDMGVNIKMLEFDNFQDLFSGISKLDSSNDYDGFIIDSELSLSHRTLRNLIKMSYYNRKFIIGASPGLVEAGSLATSYSNIDDHVRQASNTIREFLKSEKMPGNAFPKLFQVKINKRVASAFGLREIEEVVAYQNIQYAIMEYLNGDQYVAKN